MYDHLDPEHYARRDDALARVREAGVQIVELQFSDITGGAKSLSMPAGLLAATFDNGYRFDGSALTPAPGMGPVCWCRSRPRFSPPISPASATRRWRGASSRWR